jgi:nitroreductase
MTFEDFTQLCRDRHSVRFFKDVSVPKEEVLHLIETARLAPSVENTQPWHFHIVENRGLQHKLMETSCYGNFIEGAGIFVVISCDTSIKPSSNEIIWNPKELEYSCVTAMSYMLLGATAAGLGSCFVSLHHGTAHKLLQLPMHQIVVGGVMLGYPVKDEPMTGEHDRKPLKELFTIY